MTKAKKPLKSHYSIGQFQLETIGLLIKAYLRFTSMQFPTSTSSRIDKIGDETHCSFNPFSSIPAKI